MKYILLMSGTKAGVDTYHAWSQKDIETHMAVLRDITNDLIESGEFVATQGLAGPNEAKVVRGEKNGMPVTDGIFPESKEFLLGYWRAMAKQAEAEREKRSKIIHSEGEFSAAQRLVDAAKLLATEPVSIQLRYLQTLTEIGVEKNTTIVFPLPLNILEGLSQVGRQRATGSMLPKGAAFST